MSHRLGFGSKCVRSILAFAAITSLVVPAQAFQGAQTGAVRVGQVIRQLNLEKPGSAAQEFILLEADLNDYGKRIAQKKPALGVQDVEIDLQPGGIIAARAVLDMDKFEIRGFAASMFKTFFSGRQTFKCVGRFIVENAKGRYEVDQASFNDSYIPAWLAGTVIGLLGERQAQLDPTEPFVLPFGIRDVKTTADELRIVR